MLDHWKEPQKWAQRMIQGSFESCTRKTLGSHFFKMFFGMKNCWHFIYYSQINTSWENTPWGTCCRCCNILSRALDQTTFRGPCQPHPSCSILRGSLQTQWRRPCPFRSILRALNWSSIWLPLEFPGRIQLAFWCMSFVKHSRLFKIKHSNNLVTTTQQGWKPVAHQL